MDVALSNKELTNEALRSDLMLRLSQSLIIYIGLSECLSRSLLLIIYYTIKKGPTFFPGNILCFENIIKLGSIYAVSLQLRS
jgi:hypothetical protein